MKFRSARAARSSLARRASSLASLFRTCVAARFAKVDYGHVEQEDLDVQLQLRAADAVARRVVPRRRNHRIDGLGLVEPLRTCCLPRLHGTQRSGTHTASCGAQVRAWRADSRCNSGPSPDSSRDR